jgi:3-oxoacyl-[acyl-carrier-protein] synthase II
MNTEGLMKRRVVVTGMGAISPNGKSADEMWNSMISGISGIKELSIIDTEDVPVHFAGEIRDFNALDYMDKKQARRMDRFCQFAYAAAGQAMDDADFGEKMPDTSRFGVLIGSGIGGLTTMQEEVTKMNAKGFRYTSPLFVPMMIGNIAPGMIAMRYGLKGHNTCVVTACASGSHAIGDAYRLIKDGYMDAMLTGGAEAPITRLAMSGFCNLKALTLTDDINRASIPFDAERSGFVMGEGAGMLVLEEYEHAKARGARIYGEIAGYGSSCDAYHMTAPHPEAEGLLLAMNSAIDDAEISAQNIDYINAHGTSTELNDSSETFAIKKAFGEHAYKLKVSSTKSMTGHMLGATGAIEAIVCLKAICEGVIPPTINYKVPDEVCDLDYVPNTAIKAQVQTAMSNSLGFGGQNACLIFKQG